MYYIHDDINLKQNIFTKIFTLTIIARTINKHLWEYILEAVLNLLRRDVSEYGRHLVQYFGFFVNYANLGDIEKRQLIEVCVYIF